MRAFDCETALIVPGLQAPPLSCLSMNDATLVGWREAEDVAHWLLASSDVLVGHNVAFDFIALAAEFPHLMPTIFKAYDDDRIEDTEIRQKLIDLAAGSLGWGGIDGKRVKFKYSLDELTRRHLGATLDKKGPWRLRYGELRDVPVASWPEGARRYAIEDAQATGEVWQLQEPYQHLFADQYRQTRAAFWIKLMSCWGMTTSPTAVAEFEREARANYSRLAAMLVAGGLKRPDRSYKSGPKKGTVKEGARDTKATMTRLVAAYAAKGVPHPTTKTGLPSLEEDACIKSGDPILKAYGDFGSASKTLSTDVPLVQAGRFQPIHANFEVLLETGDIGCSAPNLVNLPTREGVRECFVPRPGFVFIACDYSAMQLRTWAQVCIWLLGYSQMAQVLNADGDPHCMVAADLLGTTYEDAIARKSEIYFERQCGKVCFHPDTEVLTRRGWKRITALTYADQVCSAFFPNNSSETILEWEEPLALTQREFSGDLVQIDDIRVTPDHRMLGWEGDFIVTRRAEDFGALKPLTLPARIVAVAAEHARYRTVLERGLDDEAKIRRVPYAGSVYCLTTRNDTVVVRDGGVAMITRQCNFGLPGGMGAERLVHAAANQYQVVITEEKARALKKTWLRIWSEAGPYLELIGRMTNAGQIQIKQFLSDRIRGGLSYCDTANTLFSGLAFDAIKSAGFLVSRACYVDESSPLFGSRTVNCVHDELLLESPEEIAHEACEELERLMIAGAAPWLPDVPPKVESVLMRRWSKSAKPARDARGRRIPSEDKKK